MLTKVVTQLLPKLRRSQALPEQSSFSSSTDIAEVPVFEFGMIGFNAKERQQIESLVNSLPHTTAMWRSGQFSDADAWLVCGEKARINTDGQATKDEGVRVLAGLPSERATVLNLNQVKRALAFSTPLHSADIEPMFTFEATSAPALQNTFQQFEQCMRQLRSQIIVGKQLIEHEAQLKPAVYHVMHNGQLLAVLDFINWKIGILSSANPEHLERAIWEKRPTQAGDIPNGFLQTDAAELRWMYARHSERDVLPVRYRHDLIYFRQAPTVPVSWLTDSHLLLVHELSIRPAHFQQLAERTGMPYQQLTRDLACLYFAASLTTMASKAASATGNQSQPVRKFNISAVKKQGNIFNSSLHQDAHAAPDSDATVPAQLRGE
jgi:hypothetical protein